MSLVVHSHTIIQVPIVHDVYQFFTYFSGSPDVIWSSVELIKYIAAAFQVFNTSFLYKTLVRRFEKHDKCLMKIICAKYKWDYDKIYGLFNPEEHLELSPDELINIKSELTDAHMYAGSQHSQIAIRTSNFDEVLIERRYNKHEIEAIRNIYGKSDVLVFLRSYGRTSELGFVFFTPGVNSFAPQTSTLNHLLFKFTSNDTILQNKRIYQSLELVKYDLERVVVIPDQPKSKINIFIMLLVILAIINSLNIFYVW